MQKTISEAWLADAAAQFEQLESLAEKALAQVGDESFFWVPDPESNSLALLVKHLAGNMRSRWTDFLTTDGEKPDRLRDREFEIAQDDTRVSLMAKWAAGWQCLFSALRSLTPDDLLETVTIRSEPLSVIRAIDRQMTHTAYHVGQIVFLAKHVKARDWKTLSIPRGRSAEFDAELARRVRERPSDT